MISLVADAGGSETKQSQEEGSREGGAAILSMHKTRRKQLKTVTSSAEFESCLVYTSQKAPASTAIAFLVEKY